MLHYGKLRLSSRISTLQEKQWSLPLPFPSSPVGAGAEISNDNQYSTCYVLYSVNVLESFTKIVSVRAHDLGSLNTIRLPELEQSSSALRFASL